MMRKVAKTLLIVYVVQALAGAALGVGVGVYIAANPSSPLAGWVSELSDQIKDAVQ